MEEKEPSSRYFIGCKSSKKENCDTKHSEMWYDASNKGFLLQNGKEKVLLIKECKDGIRDKTYLN